MLALLLLAAVHLPSSSGAAKARKKRAHLPSKIAEADDDDDAAVVHIDPASQYSLPDEVASSLSVERRGKIIVSMYAIPYVGPTNISEYL